LNDTAKEVPMGQDNEHGEGNYKASRDYDEAAHRTAQDKDKVEKAARDAEQALDGDEAEELAQAEAEGRSHAKS
jgi:prefoldin subunit 5